MERIRDIYSRAASGRIAEVNKKWIDIIVSIVHLSVVLWSESKKDKLPIRAAMLSYWTTVAIVPMLLLAFALTGPLELFDQAAIRTLFYNTLLAGSIDAVGEELDRLLSQVNFAGLGLVGTMGVMLIGAQLYFHVETAYNDIFRCRIRRSYTARFFMFYAGLTLGPILIAWGFYTTSQLTDNEHVHNFIGYILPTLLTSTVLIGAIRALPDTTVSWRSALWGGLTSAILFELAKRGFGAYTELLGTTDSMARLYGALGLFPVFLLWLSVLWTLVLIGVEVAYVHAHWNTLMDRQHRWAIDRHNEHRKPDVFFAIAVMTGITERYVQGLGPTSSDDLAALLGADARHIRQTIEILEDAHILTECESQHFLPARPPEQITGQLVASAWRRVTAPLINRDTPGEAPINNGIDALTMALDIPLVPSRKAD